MEGRVHHLPLLNFLLKYKEIWSAKRINFEVQSQQEKKDGLVNGKRGLPLVSDCTRISAHVLKGEMKIDSYMLRHGFSSVNLDLDFDINAICELFSIQEWEAFKELWEKTTSL